MFSFWLFRILTEGSITAWGVSRFLKPKSSLLRPWLLFAAFSLLFELIDRLLWPLAGVQNIIRIPLGVLGLLLMACLYFEGQFFRKFLVTLWKTANPLRQPRGKGSGL